MVKKILSIAVLSLGHLLLFPVAFTFQPQRQRQCHHHYNLNILQASSQKNSNINPVPAQYDFVDRESHWVYMFYLLMVYKEREGHCRVPTSHVEADWKLGYWLAKQREAFKLGTLNPTYQSRLEEVGVVWDPCGWQWEARFEALQEFQKKHGNCDVPQFHQEENGESLGIWLNKQRRDYRIGKLSKDRVKRLEEIGVAWNVFGKRWEQIFDLLVQFQEREGHCIVPIDHVENDKKLGAWVSTQRKAKRNNTLDAGRQEMLDSVGMVWSVQEAQWESMFSLTTEYIKREETTEIPLKHVEKGKNLGHWISKQKQLNTREKLEPDRQRRLSEVGVL